MKGRMTASSLRLLETSPKMAAPSAARSNAPFFTTPGKARSSARVQRVPGFCRSCTSWSQSITATFFVRNQAVTVDLPVAMPPVRPTSSISVVASSLAASSGAAEVFCSLCRWCRSSPRWNGSGRSKCFER